MYQVLPITGEPRQWPNNVRDLIVGNVIGIIVCGIITLFAL